MTEKKLGHLIDRIYLPYKAEVVVRTLEAEGIPVERALQGTGLTEPDLTSTATRISLQQLSDIFRNAMQLSRDPAFAIRAGQQVHITGYGMYGYAMICSPTLRSALDFYFRFWPLATPTCRQGMSLEGDWAYWWVEDALEMDDIHDFNIQYQMSLCHSLFLDVMGRDSGFAFSEVLLRQPRPECELSFREIFGCPVSFGQEQDALYYSTSWLDESLRLGHPITHEQLTAFCEKDLTELEVKNSIVRQVQFLILEDISHMPTIDEVAGRLHMTARTLRRKLDAYGTSFQDIGCQVRRELSVKYLRDTALTIEQIAEKVGFSDVSNFRQAFKRWTDQPPGAYRDAVTNP